MTLLPAILSATLDLLQDFSSGTVFTNANSSVADFRVMDAGGTSKSAVVTMGGASSFGDRVDSGFTGGASSYGAHDERQERHAIKVSIYVKRGQGAGGDAVAYSLVINLASEVVAWLNRYPALDGTPNVREMTVEGMSQVGMYGSPSAGNEAATHYGIELDLVVRGTIDLETEESAG